MRMTEIERRFEKLETRTKTLETECMIIKGELKLKINELQPTIHAELKDDGNMILKSLELEGKKIVIDKVMDKVEVKNDEPRTAPVSGAKVKKTKRV